MATDYSRVLTREAMTEMDEQLRALWSEMWSQDMMEPPDPVFFGTSVAKIWMSEAGKIQWSKIQPLDWMATVDAPGLPAAGQAGPITMAPTTRKCALCGDTVPIDKPACQRAMDCVDLGQIIARKKLLKEM